jgi:hypothetical protein
MPTYTFEKVEHPAQKNTKCIGCGKRLRRRTTLYQTLNPFNKNAQGQPKSRQEIYAELEAKAERWLTAPEWCEPCGEVLQVRASELAVGDVLVMGDSTRIPVDTVDREPDGYSGRVVVNVGADVVELTGSRWVTRFPAGHSAIAAG